MDDKVTDEEFLENLRQEHDWMWIEFIPEGYKKLSCTCGYLPYSQDEVNEHEAETADL